MLLQTRTFFGISFLLFSLAIAVSAQDNQAKIENDTNRQSYEISLQLLVSAQNGERNELPSALAAIEKKLKNDFGQSNFRLAMNLLNRVSENGSLELKGISTFSQSTLDDKTYSFYELGLKGIKSNSAGEMQFNKLRFNMRVPVVISLVQEGKSSPPTINYENTGISAQPVNVAFNEPTIVGTMTTPRPNELIVLVLTVKPDNAKTSLSVKKN